jgi:excisionase family DNA binding protein
VQWAADYLGCSVMTVLRYRERGLIEGYQMCERGWWRLFKDSIMKYEAQLRARAQKA